MPADYSVVAYVASSGAQYVNTGIVPKSTTRVVCDFRLPALPSGTILCGWGSRGSAEAFLFGATTTEFTSYVSASWKALSTSINVDTDRHVFDLSNRAMMIDGVTYGTLGDIGDTATAGQTMYLFACHAEWQSAPANSGAMEIYSCRIYDGDTPVRNLIPVKRVSDSVPGFYDDVAGGFYPSASATPLLAGPDGPDPLADYVAVCSSTIRLGTPSPDYGRLSAASGDNLVFTCPSAGTNANGLVSGTCAGWRLYAGDSETPFRSSEDPGESPLTCALQYSSPVRLEWVWNDVREHGWRFDTSAKTLTELGVPAGATPWVFGGSLTETNISLSSVKTVGSNTALDFRQPMGGIRNDQKYALIALWNNAFSGKGTIEEVALPDTMETLHYRAFFNCTALRHARLPSRLVTMNEGVFQGCTALESVEPFLPDTLATLGKTVFDGCSSLAQDLVLMPNAPAATIGNQCFEYSAITSVTMGDGITALPYRCFFTCANLRQVRLPARLETINEGVFESCSKLVTVEPFLPATVTTIGKNAFYNDPLVSGDLVIDGGGNAVTFGGSYAFSCGPGIRTATLSTNVASLPSRTFWNDTGLEKLLFGRWTTWANDTFATIPAGQCRFIVPAGDADWEAFVANTSKATKWEALTDEQRASYAAAYPGHPDARAYTKAAPANQWIVSYGRGVAGESDLLIDGQPVRRAADLVAPSYGTHTNVAALFGVPAALTAPRYADEPTIRYQCVGYGTASFSHDGRVTNVVEHAFADPTAPAVSYTPPGDGLHRVTWFWEEAAYTLTISEPTDSSIGGTVVSGPLVDGYYASNAVVTVTAVPGSGTFAGWSGDVPAGHETDNPLTLVMDRPKRLVPEFATEWVYDSGTKTVTDGYWTLNATVSGTNLTVGKPKVAYEGGLLDLAKPVRGGYVFAAIADSAFNGNAVIRSLRLPNTVTRIGGGTFKSCANLTSVSPFLPDSVSAVGYQAFCNTPVAGCLRLGFGSPVTLETGSYGDGSQFYGTRVEEVVGGPQLVGFSQLFMYNNPALTNLDLRLATALTTVGRGAFQSCAALRTAQNFLPDSVTTINYRAFYNCPVEGRLRLGFGAAPLTLGTGDYDNGEQFYGCRVGEIVGGPQLRHFSQVFMNNNTALTNIDLRLASAFERIDIKAFVGCTALRTITPLLPDTVVNVAHRVFLGCPLEGELRIGFGRELTLGVGDYSEAHPFNGSRIGSVVGGPALTAFPKCTFAGMASLTNVDLTLSKNLATMGGFVFDGDTQIQTLKLNAYPTWVDRDLRNSPATMRVFLSRSVPEWDAWLADSAKATPWDALAASAKGDYYTLYGANAKRPVGRAVVNLAPFPKNAWLLRYSADLQTMIILR